MKKVLLVCALVLGISAVSFAQGGGRMRMTPQAQTDTLKAHVSGVTADQSTKLLAVYTGVAKTRDSLRQAGGGGDRDAMRAMYTKMQASTDAKVKAVLTADQAKEYQAWAEKRAAAMRARMNGN